MKFMCGILVVAFFVGSLDSTSLAAGAQAAKSDHELMQGTWVCVSTVKDGKVVKDYVGVRAVIAGDNLTWYFPRTDGSYTKGECKFRIDPSKNPKQFDWWLVRRPETIDQRLYVVNERALGWSTNLDYKTRPEKFASGRWIYAMQRSDAPQEHTRITTIPSWGTVIDPDGDCTIRRNNDTLVIGIPGSTHDMWFGSPEAKHRFNAPRVLREVSGDFIARVKVTCDWKLTSGSSYNGAGLVVWDSENQYLRLERNRYVRGSEPRGPFSGITPLYDVNQQRTPGWRTSPEEFFRGRSTWLRIERLGARITTSVSHDGATWLQTGALATQFPDRVQVGVLAINTSPLGFVVEFDDFKVLKE